jgi:serine/threonine protein phosphatase PrpC
VIYESLDETGRKIQTGLAMSRSLGDTAAKELGVVVSDPDIVTFTFPDSVNTVPSALPMKSNNYFVMLASDGLMDVMELSDLIILLGTALYDQRRSMSLETVCHTIVEHAVNNWNQATGNRYRDDISLAVHRIS